MFYLFIKSSTSHIVIPDFLSCHSGLDPESLVINSRILQLTEQILKQVQDDRFCIVMLNLFQHLVS